MKGGEVDAERLLQLAVQEISQEILPELSGDARYRTRLVLNALKIANAELRDLGGLEAVKGAQYESVLPSMPEDQGTREDRLAMVERSLQTALRQGEYDGDAALHQSLLVIAEARCCLVR